MTTAAERKHLAALANLGCIVCRNIGHYGTHPEIHHLRTGMGTGQRNSHYNAIPLCHVHHRTGNYGTAFHAGQAAFEKNFGTELELWAQVQELLKAAA